MRGSTQRSCGVLLLALAAWLVAAAMAARPGSGGERSASAVFDAPLQQQHLAPAGAAQPLAAENGGADRTLLAPPRGSGQQRGRRRGGSGGAFDGRCVGTTGAQWCGGFYAQAPLAYKRPPVLSKPCPGGCSGIGVCHGDTGACDCPAGVSSPCPLLPLTRPHAAATCTHVASQQLLSGFQNWLHLNLQLQAPAARRALITRSAPAPRTSGAPATAARPTAT